MSKVKEIYVEAKLSACYNTITSGIKLEIEPSDDVEVERAKAMAKCIKQSKEQLAIQAGIKERGK